MLRRLLKNNDQLRGASSLFLRRPRSKGITGIQFNAFFHSRSLELLRWNNWRLLLRNNDLEFHLKWIIENDNSFKTMKKCIKLWIFSSLYNPT